MAFIVFEEITWLWIGIIIVGLFIVIYYLRLRKQKYFAKKLSTTVVLKKVVKKRTFKENIITILILLALLSLFVALANPMMRLKGEGKGANVVLVIDTSGSMNANDFKPSRIESAKESAIGFVKELGPKDRVGVISFSSNTRIISFLTNDKEKVIESIKTLKAGGATAIGDALALGVDMVTSIPSDKRLIILLSDGEQNAGKISIDEAIQYAKSEDVTVYTVGVGSNKHIILGYDWFGRPVYATLDETALKKIAYSTGGKYYRATNEVNLKSIYKSLPKIVKQEKVLRSIKDWFIELAIVLLISSLTFKYWKNIKVW